MFYLLTRGPMKNQRVVAPASPVPIIHLSELTPSLLPQTSHQVLPKTIRLFSLINIFPCLANQPSPAQPSPAPRTNEHSPTMHPTHSKPLNFTRHRIHRAPTSTQHHTRSAQSKYKTNSYYY